MEGGRLRSKAADHLVTALSWAPTILLLVAVISIMIYALRSAGPLEILARFLKVVLTPTTSINAAEILPA